MVWGISVLRVDKCQVLQGYLSGLGPARALSDMGTGSEGKQCKRKQFDVTDDSFVQQLLQYIPSLNIDTYTQICCFVMQCGVFPFCMSFFCLLCKVKFE